ncbi:hypothetical protein GTP23_07995 [Pseudoduganella sp. FT93W]|uniref:Uncharacterized protein n=1 Tax=Duganella fentianensis TaxID=2692177 RepID=A0A845HV82_9BURK|nr:hypothetical protein [Duganella fentianensis]MYN45010.1 hypothetical protein [Duganella fentianensis]
MIEPLLKGPAAEEALRNYFLSIGYFVIRGPRFQYNGFDVTDVDLWLYGKSSPLSRERINVDIKNKKTPQALERIFWAKGLQSILGFSGCIVATSDVRPDVREFGLQHDVKVFDGRFMARLTKSQRSQQERISEENFFEELDNASLGKLGGDWRGKYEASKSRILDSLSFDGCNAWLEDLRYFFGEIMTQPNPPKSTWRMINMTAAFFVVAIDFILREHISAEHEQRKVLLEDGFRYGTAGRAYAEKLGRMASGLVGQFTSQPGLAKSIEHELHEQAKEVRAEVLAEFFSRSATHTNLFDIARELEAAAFDLEVRTPGMLSASTQALFGIIADFFSLDRKRVLI